MKQPIKTVTCGQSELDNTKQELINDGYMIVQVKRSEAVGDKKATKWTIKAKLASPPHKPGRELID